MAKLIKPSGTEQEVSASNRNGFCCEDIVRLFGPEIRMIPLSPSIVIVVADGPASQRNTQKNQKATRIAQFALSDSLYEIYGSALFVSSEELRPFVEEARAQQEKSRHLHSQIAFDIDAEWRQVTRASACPIDGGEGGGKRRSV